MTYVITQSCCTDSSCVSVCPVDCIHPTPNEPDFGQTDILYVDPRACIDCGACADACPVSAIKPAETLLGSQRVFIDLNAAYYERRPEREVAVAMTWDEFGVEPTRTLRVAIVGTGPAASYTARHLLLSTDAQISMIDKSPVPGGLVRGGVAPDHVETKEFQNQFHWAYKHPRTAMFMNVEVGRDVSHEELLEYHDAVIYGVGARQDRELGVPGESLDGVLGAPDVVGWYNGSLDVDSARVGAGITGAGDRVVIVGNGNVALDVARLLLEDPKVLAHTDIADQALDVFRSLSVREVVLLGRRGPAEAAFTRPELLMMPPEIEVVVARDEATEAALAEAAPESNAEVLAALPLVDVDLSVPPSGVRRLVLAFGRQVTQVQGTDRVQAVHIAPTGRSEGGVAVPCGTLVRSTGHRGARVPGLPFDEASATIPHEHGRVIDPETGKRVTGAYVVGWIKRGASGGIGTNRADAHDTVQTMVRDANEGLLTAPRKRRVAFEVMIRRRVEDVVGRRRMLAIEKAEEKRGAKQGRPRVKFETAEDMLKVHSVTGLH
jgi:ferredoxin--NADP+ reductase